MLVTLTGKRFVRFLRKPCEVWKLTLQQTDECHHLTEFCRQNGLCGASEIGYDLSEEPDGFHHPFRMKVDEAAELAFVSGELVRFDAVGVSAVLTMTACRPHSYGPRSGSI